MSGRQKPQVAFVFILCLISGCGLLNESELAPSTLIKEKNSASCSIEERLRQIDEFTEAEVRPLVNCLESQLSSMKANIHGATSGEIQVSELRKLVEQQWLELPSVERHPGIWPGVGQLASLFHPEGRAAFHFSSLFHILNRIREHLPFTVQLAQRKPFDLTQEEYDRVLDITEDVTLFFSNESKLQVEALLPIVDFVCDEVEHFAIKQDCKERTRLKNLLLSGWRLKPFVVSSNLKSLSTSLTGSGLRDVFRFGLELFRKTYHLVRWTIHETNPQKAPSKADLQKEVNHAVATVSRYFTRSFLPIPTEEVALVFRRFDASSGLAELVPDVARVGWRLSPEKSYSNAFHPTSWLSLIKPLPSHVSEMRRIVRLFENCPSPRSCFRSIRSLKGTPAESLAYKGSIESFWKKPGEKLKKRLDNLISWKEIFHRYLKQVFFEPIFQVFDRNKDGKIRYLGDDPDEITEALDLAYAFLSFLSRGPSVEENPFEITARRPVFIRPSAVYRSLGIIGDRWVPDGNQDGQLNSVEFFTALQLYSTIQLRNEYASYYWEVPRFTDRIHHWPQKVFFSRKQFLEKYPQSLTFVPNHMAQALRRMPTHQRRSFFDALLPKAQKPKLVYRPPNPKAEWLSDPIESDATIGAIAVLTFLDRLFFLCDANEDEQFDWEEMDCAVPLMVDAADTVLQSELVALDLGLDDGVKLLLKFLGKKGLPRHLLKAILINGSLSQFRLGDLFIRVTDQLSTDWNDIAELIRNSPLQKIFPPSKPILELVLLHYGACDKDIDGHIRGREWDCLSKKLVTDCLKILQGVGVDFSAKTIQAIQDRLARSHAIRLGVVLATQGPGTLTEKLKSFPEFSTRPDKILSVIEEVIRRRASD